jgi:hypothetical protein
VDRIALLERRVVELTEALQEVVLNPDMWKEPEPLLYGASDEDRAEYQYERIKAEQNWEMRERLREVLNRG